MFGKNLKSLRAKRGMTQAELAEASGIHKRYYQDVEAGRKIPSVVIAARMRKTLKCTWEELTRGVKQKGSVKSPPGEKSRRSSKR